MNLELDWKVLVRAYPGMPRGGDSGLVIRKEGSVLAVLIDGSGHGLAAYAVAQKARSHVLGSETERPDALLMELHEVLKGSIGAAISVARIREGAVEFAGIGNVQASIDLSPFVVQPGMVGHRMRTPRLSTMSMQAGQWLLMHTDGVSRPRELPTGNADTVARKLMESHGVQHDDAGILLLRQLKAEP